MRAVIVVFFILLSNVTIVLGENSIDTIIFSFNSFNKGDTLNIKGYIADCGEFGGHYEFIKIYKYRSKVIATLLRNTPCRPGMDLLEGTPELLNTVSLNKTLKPLITDFIIKFNELVHSTDWDSNAPTDFEISYQNKKIYKRDQTGDWNEFIYLRNNLFKK
jgi:hypothetical protein